MKTIEAVNQLIQNCGQGIVLSIDRIPDVSEYKLGLFANGKLVFYDDTISLLTRALLISVLIANKDWDYLQEIFNQMQMINFEGR